LKLTAPPVVCGIAVIPIVLELGEKTFYISCSHYSYLNLMDA
jgi:hypothetical protein